MVSCGPSVPLEHLLTALRGYAVVKTGCPVSVTLQVDQGGRVPIAAAIEHDSKHPRRRAPSKLLCRVCSNTTMDYSHPCCAVLPRCW